MSFSFFLKAFSFLENSVHYIARLMNTKRRQKYHTAFECFLTAFNCATDPKKIVAKLLDPLTLERACTLMLHFNDCILILIF